MPVLDGLHASVPLIDRREIVMCVIGSCEDKRFLEVQSD